MDNINSDLFYSKVITDTGTDCHEWSASHFKNGYGQFKINRMPFYAHRVAYELAYGSFPKHLFVLHSCDNPGCVNPKHLSLGTHQDNMNDMRAKGRGCRKLSDQDLLEIRDLYWKGGFTQVRLAKLYGVSNVAIAKQVNKCAPILCTQEPSTTNSSTAASTQPKPSQPTNT